MCTAPTAEKSYLEPLRVASTKPYLYGAKVVKKK